MCVYKTVKSFTDYRLAFRQSRTNAGAQENDLILL